MGPWLFLIVFFLVLSLFKAYLIRGVYQAFLTKKAAIIFGSISIASLVIGMIVMFTTFSKDPMTMKLWVNLVISFMMSVLCCEAILALFFVIDDVILVGKKIVQKVRKNTDDQAEADPKSRRRFLKLAGLGFTALPFASYIYGITKGKYNYKVFKEKITFAQLPDAFDGFKIVQFSDFHSGSFDNFNSVKKGIEAIQKLKPDLILFTGDLVNDHSDEVLPYKEALKALSAPYGKYSVLGNHDYYGSEGHGRRGSGTKRENGLGPIMQHHADMNFGLLNNEHTLIEKDGQQFSLLGVENWGKSFNQEGDLDQALVNCPENNFTILLSHDPTHWEEKVKSHPRHIDLTLSGHTHGMQMGIEIGKIKWSPVQYIYKHWAGLYKDDQKQHLYVNRGFGFLGFAGRVGIPPEITLFELKKA